MKPRLSILIVIPCLFVCRSSLALPPFRKPLDARYAKANRDLRREFRRANCNICHPKNKNHHFVNDYGKVLADLIPGNAEQRLEAAASIDRDSRDTEYAIVMRELEDAIKKADRLPTSSSVTYGELFRSCRIPSSKEFHALPTE